MTTARPPIRTASTSRPGSCSLPLVDPRRALGRRRLGRRSRALGGHNEFEHFLDPVFAAAQRTRSTPTSVSHAASSPASPPSLSSSRSSVLRRLALLLPQARHRRRARRSASSRSTPCVEHKYYVDEFYGAFIVAPLLVLLAPHPRRPRRAGSVNGSGTLAAATTRGLGSLTRRMQSGNIRSYAGWLALGAAAVIVVMIFGRQLWLHRATLPSLSLSRRESVLYRS